MNDIGLSPVMETGLVRAPVSRGSSAAEEVGRPSAVAEAGKTLPPVAASQVSVEQVTEAAEELNRYVQGEQRDLNFQVHEDTGKVVVRVVDRSSGELIRQIPNEVVLELAAKVRNNEPLQLLSQQG